LDKLLYWNDSIQQGITYDLNGKEVMQEMATHLKQMVGNQLVRGVDSLAAAVAQAEVDGHKLTDDEIAVYFAVLLFIGTEHTRNAISNGFSALLEHPDQLTLLREEPGRLRCTKSGLAPPALEEILRWATPVNYLARTATKDTQIGTQPIKEGERVVMWYTAASRDPEAFPGAETFDVTRPRQEPPHYAFGGGGPHYCQAPGLANRMVSITLMEVLKRMTDLTPSGQPARVPSSFVNAPTSIPVTFTKH
jgi:cytochrome P450